jgi:hypothetical protein
MDTDATYRVLPVCVTEHPWITAIVFPIVVFILCFAAFGDVADAGRVTALIASLSFYVAWNFQGQFRTTCCQLPKVLYRWWHHRHHHGAHV